MVSVKLRNKITRKRAYATVILVCLEAFLQPIHATLTQGVWPSPVQVAAAGSTAILQGITLLISLIEKA